MDVMSFVKRFVPFVAAFSVGIFVASFFVDLSAPRFEHGRGRGRCRSMKFRMERLERENQYLRRQLEENSFSDPLPRIESPDLPPIPGVRAAPVDEMTFGSTGETRQRRVHVHRTHEQGK
ncbi:MAG: hypothetical protein UZ17_ACD001001277 [Acidobacteria bacterium OLB17]|nr:MAG: hypothetical protein UZ17_ACD001001277 [Acidobacteria bacterium OLB17]MCZ2391677.1 hypothetical protein [Acidobacteriota bacterium]